MSNDATGPVARERVWAAFGTWTGLILCNLCRTLAHPLCPNPCTCPASLVQYMKAMSCNGTWGDELTLRAACDSYGAVVRCITSEEANW